MNYKNIKNSFSSQKVKKISPELSLKTKETNTYTTPVPSALVKNTLGLH